jgi:hypothetical protein
MKRIGRNRVPKRDSIAHSSGTDLPVGPPTDPVAPDFDSSRVTLCGIADKFLRYPHKPARLVSETSVWLIEWLIDRLVSEASYRYCD